MHAESSNTANPAAPSRSHLPSSRSPSAHPAAPRTTARRRSGKTVAFTTGRWRPPPNSPPKWSGVPSGSSNTPSRCTSPQTVKTMVPEHLGAVRPQPVGAVGQDVGQRLDVVDQRRVVLGRPGEQPLDERASHPRQRRAPLDHLLHPGLLPEQVQIRAEDDFTERLRARPLPASSQRPAQGLELRGERFLQAHVGIARRRPRRRDGQALEDLVGAIRSSSRSLKVAGSALPRRCRRRSEDRPRPPDRPPLLTGREPRASPAAEPASRHLPDHRQAPRAAWSLASSPAAS